MIRYELAADGWVGHADVRVGVEHVPLSIELGALDREPDAAGLRGTPVVVVASASLPVVRAGVARAGKAPSVLVVASDVPHFGGKLLAAVDEGAEVDPRRGWER